MKASKTLADRILQFVLVKFRKINLENEDELDVLCQISGCLLNIYAKKELGKLTEVLASMIEASLNEKCKSWKVLLQSVCNNHLLFSPSNLPLDWRIRSLKILVDEENLTDSVFLKALLKTASTKELE